MIKSNETKQMIKGFLVNKINLSDLFGNFLEIFVVVVCFTVDQLFKKTKIRLVKLTFWTFNFI